jgi:hypothetical protein
LNRCCFWKNALNVFLKKQEGFKNIQVGKETGKWYENSKEKFSNKLARGA